MVAMSSRIVVALLVILTTNGFSAQREATQEIEVSVERIERQANRDVHIWLKVENLKEESIFLAVIATSPAIDTSRLLYVQFVLVEQWEPANGWKTVGPWGDVPPPAVAEVKPSHSVKGHITISELLLLSRGGGTICIEGKHRIKLWYFNSRDEWDNYWADLMNGRKPRGKRPMAISKPFEIPRASRQK